jgi:spermidine synthase
LACGFVVALPWRVAAASLVTSVVLAVMAPGPRWFLGSTFDEARVLAAHVGVQDTAAVVLHDQPVEPMIRRLVAAGVSYSGDSRFAQRYMRLLAHLPALAARRRTRALVICIGTGTTLDALRMHAFSRIDAVDIDPSIRETLRHFAHVHHGAPDAPEVRLHVTDGARFLRACAPRSYDVITLEPPPPRAPGGSSLYTEESYQLARAALAEGGVVAQWVPLHDMGAWEAACLVETFLRVFPRGAFYLAERNEAVLLSEGRALSTAMAPAVRADLTAVGFRSTDPLRETLFADASGLRAAWVDARVVTDAWPGPELAPLSLQRPVVPLSVWASRVAERTIAAPGTFAATMAPALAPFLRVLEGSAREGDRAEVSAVMRTMLLRDPDDVYLQHMHGYGPLLTERLDGLEREGADPRVIAVTRARIEALRARSLQR